MPRLLTCPQGHRWELPETEGSSATGLQVLCPVCGASVDLQEPARAEPASAETGTYHPAGADQSEAETLTPKLHGGPEEVLDVLPAGDVLTPAPEIAGYEILALLGRGGMGMVYKARQSKLDRLVALKILPQETSSDSTFAERFTREARALARLNHSNIVGVYDFGQAGNLSYFVMEYVDGLNLRQLMRAGPIAPRETLKIMSQICDALQYAHDEGIVHRDIKPENILRDKRGRAKIADFGIAKLLARKAADYTLTGPWQVVGTFNYMAPEQIENPQKLDHRADIYSLGVMFYEMLTGGLPMGRFPLPSQKASVDRRIDEVVLKALEKEPERRYQHIRDLKAAIDGLLAGSGSGIRPAMRPWRPQAAASPTDPFISPPTEYPSAIPVGAARERIRQRLRNPSIALMIVGALEIGISAWVAISVFKSWEGALPLGLPGILKGLAIVLGGWQIQRLRGYKWGIVSCVLAMLPCFTPSILLGLPVGIWTLLVLRRPEIRASFTR
jgi:serine/threonine protein kinase